MTRVAILTEIRLYGEGVAAALAGDDFEVVRVTQDVDALVEVARAREPDVVVVDVTHRDAYPAVAAILRAAPGTQIVALGVRDVERQVIACAEAGIAGYVSRDDGMNDLRRAIVAAVSGELACTPRVARNLLDELRRRSVDVRRSDAATPQLTSRETEIVRLIDRGLSNKEIARALLIGVSTVKNHVHAILEKLQVDSRTAAAATVRRAGLHT